MGSAWDKKTNLTQWRKTRRLVLSRDRWTCQIQGPKCTRQATEVDHILGVGVSEALEHLRAACKPCNSGYRPPSNPPASGRTQW